MQCGSSFLIFLHAMAWHLFGFSVANWYSSHSHIYLVSLAPHAEGGIQGLVHARQELYY